MDGISDAVRSALEAAALRECLVTYSFKDPQRQAAEDRKRREREDRDRERRDTSRLGSSRLVSSSDADKLKEYMKSCGLEAWHSHFVKHTCVAHSTLPLKNQMLPSHCQQAKARAAIACVYALTLCIGMGATGRSGRHNS
eukprot:COSAG01_NODE_13782_length_1536_cov_2.658316_2_plen_140_part_00